MSKAWSDAAEVRDIASELIAKFHPHLIPHTVEFLLQDQPDKTRGRERLANARKLTGLAAYWYWRSTGTIRESDEHYPEDLFLICVWKKAWEQLPPSKRMALIDHELCHCTVEVDTETGEETLKLATHDLEEFEAIVRRHGAWNKDIEVFVLNVHNAQPSLFDPTSQRFADISYEEADAMKHVAGVSVNGGPMVPVEQATEEIAKVLRKRRAA